MFPVHDDNPTIGTPLATVALIGLNLAAWVLCRGWGRPSRWRAPSAASA
jgi:hypothetical protein